MNNNKPMLQIALDTFDLDSALEKTRLVHESIEIIEVGTILCLAEGLGAVKTIKTLYPDKIVLADVRIVEAGGIISKMVFDSGADWVSMMSAATLSTMEVVAKETFSRGRDVQVELLDDWDRQKADQWLELGIKQVIFHRSRDAEAKGLSWDDETLQMIADLAGQGFKVSVTGKLAPQDISLFKGIPVYAFVAGRAIREAADPKAAADEFQNAIRETWK